MSCLPRKLLGPRLRIDRGLTCRLFDQVCAADIDAPHVEVRAGFTAQDFANAIGRHAPPIRAIGRERVDDVGNGKDAGGRRKIRSGEAEAIALPVDPLVVVRGIHGEVLEAGDSLEHAQRVSRVSPDDRPLVRIERAGLIEDAVGDRQLAQVVQQRCPAQPDRIDRADWPSRALMATAYVATRRE